MYFIGSFALSQRKTKCKTIITMEQENEALINDNHGKV